MRLCYLILVAATRGAPLVARTRDQYAQFWSREFDKGRCDAHACSWMGGFGAIDVGCEFVVDRAGLTDGSAPAFSLVYNDGERLTVDARDASLTTRFKTRPALCEYGNATSDVALLMVANAPAYVFRLWGPILNKLLYATDAGLRPMLWIGDLPRALRTPESQCLQSPVWKSKFYGAFVLNRRVLHAIDATPARWRGDAGSSPLDRARSAASSPRNDIVKNCRAPDTLVDFHTGLDGVWAQGLQAWQAV